MLFSVLQGGISEVTQLFLKGRLKKWWDYHKIDRHIAIIIEDTCDDEGFVFDHILNRLGVNSTVIKERLKLLKKSFKEKKTYTATEEFIDEVIETYLAIFLKAEGSAVQDNPLISKELDYL